jgi:hypothetical protein
MTQPTDRAFKAILTLEEIDLTTGKTLSVSRSDATAVVVAANLSDAYAVIGAVEDVLTDIASVQSREKLEETFHRFRSLKKGDVL